MHTLANLRAVVYHVLVPHNFMREKKSQRGLVIKITVIAPRISGPTQTGNQESAIVLA